MNAIRSLPQCLLRFFLILNSNFCNSASVSLGSVLYSGEVSVEYGEIEQYNLEYITLADNKTLYLNGEKAAGSDVTVFGYTADGTKVSVARHSFTTIESDNEAVFTVQDGKVSTTDNFGFATISATYNNKDGTKVSASVMFQRSQYGNAHVDEPGVSNYISTDIAGRNADSVVYKTKQANDYIVRAYSGGDVTDYRTSTDRTTVGWFYDDMTSGCYAYYRSYIKSNAGNILFTHAESYGLIKAGDTAYGTDSATGKVNTVPRSKGWHQVVATITDSGYRLGYVDGVLVFKAAINEGVIPSDKASRLELRGQGVAYFSDFAVTDYVGIKESYAITLDATNGTITGPATVNILPPTPITYPSDLYSIAGETIEFAKPVIGIKEPAPANFPILLKQFKAVRKALAKIAQNPYNKT